MIKINDLHKTFEDNSVLSGVNLEVKDGETMAVIGGSGCGKSVLLKLIIGLLKPDSGNITINSASITGAGTSELMKIRAQFGMLFQSGALLNSLSVGENIALPLREHTNLPEKEIGRLVSEKLALVHLEGIENESPANLSGGMKKRVGLARAIVSEPRIILYDEPTSGLDPVVAHSIMDLISKLERELNVTSIVVSHDIKAVSRVADRVAMLFEGKIIEVGTPSQIAGSKNPALHQLITGDISGPMTEKWIKMPDFKSSSKFQEVHL